MRKKKIKSVLSVVLILSMVLGLTGMGENHDVMASNSPEVSLTLKNANANGAWTFGHSELTQEYQGDSASLTTVRYQLDAYKDGSDDPTNMWIEFVGEEAYIWSRDHFADHVAPATSLKIPAGTVLQECVVSGSGSEADPIRWVEKQNGKKITMREAFQAVCVDGVWKQKTATAGAEEVSLTLKSANANGAWTFGHSELTQEYQGDSVSWTTVRYQLDAYKDGSDDPTNMWIEFVGEDAYTWSKDHFADHTAPTTSLTIPKGTVLKECVVSGSGSEADPIRWEEKQNGKKITMKESFQAVCVSGVWKQETAAGEAKNVSLTFKSANASGTWTFGHSELPTEYQGDSASWTTVRYQLDAYKDGSATPTNMWIEFVGEEAYTWSKDHFADRAVPATSLTIPEGTVLKECVVSGSGNDGDPIVWSVKQDGKTMTLSQAFAVVNRDGVWSETQQEDPGVEYNDVSISFVKAEGAGFYLEATITAGPDAGKSITSVYGDWGTTADGAFRFVRNEAEENMSVLWCPCNQTQIYISGDYQHYVNELTKIIIAENTVLTPRDGSSCMTPLRITNELILVKGAAGWKVDGEEEEPVIPVAPPDAPKVLLDLVKVENDNWILSFDREEMYHTGMYQLSQIVVDGVVSYNVQIEFPTWTNEASKNWVYIYPQCFKTGLPGESFVIPEGTVLTRESDGFMYVVAADLEMKKEGNNWISNEPTVIPDVTNDIRITYDRVEGAGFYVDVQIVAGPDTGKNIADVYGEWDIPLKGNMTFVRNGQKEKMNVLWCTCNSNEIYVIGDYQHYVDELTSILLKKDTIVTPQAGSKSMIPLRVVNEMKIKKYEEYGVWGPEGMITNDTKFNDVKLTFDFFDGRGFYLTAEIVAGPDKGKNVADVYGDWASPAPSGVLTFQTKDAKTSMNVLWCPCNSNQLYVIGNFQDYSLELTHVTIAKNTLILPTMAGKSKTYMRIVNEVNLEKEPKYGLWGLKGSVKTPTEFLDVVISVKEVKGHALTLSVKAADGSEIALNDIFGPQASVWGSVELAEPKLGTYTDQRAVYTIEGGAFRLFGILPATKDSIEIKAGTVLLAHNACKSKLPIRIVNTVKLTRDEEDEWIYKVGDKTIMANGTSPITGDDVRTISYMVLLVLSCGAIVIYKRRKINATEN